jgi:hypothetical protein
LKNYLGIYGETVTWTVGTVVGLSVTSVVGDTSTVGSSVTVTVSPAGVGLMIPLWVLVPRCEKKMSARKTINIPTIASIIFLDIAAYYICKVKKQLRKSKKPERKNYKIFSDQKNVQPSGSTLAEWTVFPGMINLSPRRH